MSEFIIKKKVKPEVKQKVVRVKQFTNRELNYFKIALKVYIQAFKPKMVKGAGSEVVIEDMKELFAKVEGMVK